METMVGSHRHRSPGVGGGVPASLSGGGLPQSTSECTKSTFTVSWDGGSESQGRGRAMVQMDMWVMVSVHGGGEIPLCIESTFTVNRNAEREGVGGEKTDKINEGKVTLVH